jgi:tyrosine-protein kinase Etk/Wzc
MQRTPVIFDARADDIDLHQLTDTIVDSRWLIAKIAGGIFLLSLAYVFLASPIYRSDALILVEKKTGGIEELSSLLTGEIPAEAEMEILRSRSVINATVERLGLDIVINPKYFPIIGRLIADRYDDPETTAKPWLGMTSYAWGGERLQIGRLDVPPDLEEEKLTLVAGEADAFELRDPDDKVIATGVVNQPAPIAYSRNSNPKATPFSMYVTELFARPGTEFRLTKLRRNTVVTELQETIKIAEKGQKTGILQISLEGKKAGEVTAIVDTMASVYLRSNTERKSKQAEQTLEFLDKQLPIIKSNLDTAEMVLNKHRASNGSINLNLEIQGMLTQMAEVEKEMSVLKLQRADMLQRFTVEHPMVIAIDQKMAELNKLNAGYNGQVKKLPQTEQEVVGLMRDVKVNTDVYTLLLNKSQELKVAKAGTVGNAYIVDRPVVPDEPIKPKKPLVLAMGLGVGLLLGMVTAVVRKSLIGGVEDVEVIERQLNVPVYAVIPHSVDQAKLIEARAAMKDARFPMLAKSHPNDAAIEGLRSLRTSLQFATADAKNNIIAIGGPRPAIGKSFVSANFAYVLAEAGKTVLVIDGDMRKGYLHDYFGGVCSPGLSELLSGTVNLTAAVRRTDQPNLHFLPTGVLPPNPSELLMSDRFRQLLELASKQYDIVLIDTPPIMSVTDGAIIGSLAGANFMILRSGLHPIKEIERSIKHFEQSGARLQGVIFNDMPVRRGLYGYGKYGHYLPYGHAKSA